MERLRRTCGGHGYSQLSGLPKLYTDYVANCTLEGENELMLMESAKHLSRGPMLWEQSTSTAYLLAPPDALSIAVDISRDTVASSTTFQRETEARDERGEGSSQQRYAGDNGEGMSGVLKNRARYYAFVARQQRSNPASWTSEDRAWAKRGLALVRCERIEGGDGNDGGRRG